MNIVICHSQVPFVRGGAEALVDGLNNALRHAGHNVSRISLPFKWYPRATLEQQALLWRTLDIERLDGKPVDLVICTKFPTWAVQHPRKVVWLVHQHRQAYDWYGTPLSDFSLSPPDVRARRVVLETDNTGLGEAAKIFTISRNVAERLQRYNGLKGEPLYPPPDQAGFYHRQYGDYIFTVSRLDSAKRVEKLLQAMAHVRSGVKAIIAGAGPDSEQLQAKVTELGLNNRVQFAGRVSDAEKLELYAGALAVWYAPIDEDYGYVTIEAFRSAKAVITAPDSGGVLEFVQDEVNGYICNSPTVTATAFDQLFTDRELATRLGQSGFKTVAILPDWAEIVRQLTNLNQG